MSEVCPFSLETARRNGIFRPLCVNPTTNFDLLAAILDIIDEEIRYLSAKSGPWRFRALRLGV